VKRDMQDKHGCPTTEDATTALAAGDTFVLATSVTTITGSGGRGMILGWEWPLLLLWRRHEWNSAQAVAAEGLGTRLNGVGLLVLTDRRLLFYALRRKRLRGRLHRHPGALLGELDRADIVSLRNTTVGAGWRTCVLELRDGREASLRVPARDLAAVLAQFPDAAGAQA
jgi:hypothetical protein